MSAQKILIDPMVTHYKIDELPDSSKTISKGDKSSRKESEYALDSIKRPTPIPDNPKNDTVELKAVKEADEDMGNDLLPDYLKKAQKDGMQDAMRDSVREHRKNTFKFFGLLNKSEKIVARFKNIVPLLRGEVIIDTTKITFIHRPFFFSERIHSISVKDISDVYVETAPIFATLNVVDVNFTENLVSLNWFLKKDAEKARRIITGLMATSKEQVDLKTIEDDGLDEKLEEIGRLRGVNTSVSKA